MSVVVLGVKNVGLWLRVLCLASLLAVSARAESLKYAGVDRATVRVLALGAVDTVEFSKGNTKFTLAAPMGGHGSGFAVHEDGLIVTAAHVVVGARAVAVHVLGVMGPLPARVVHLDELRDVALLRVSHRFSDVAQLAEPGAGLAVREQVHAIGYPLDATRADPQSASGVVSGTLPDGRVQLGMNLNPGNSGGPVINQSELVLGLVSARVESDAGAQGLALAVPVEAFRADIERELASPHPFAASDENRKLADFVSLIAHEGERLVRGSLEPGSDEAVRTERQVRGLLQQMPKSPDAALLGAAFFWNRHVANQVHAQDSGVSHRNAVKLVRHAAKLDPKLKRQSKFVRHVLAAKRGVERVAGAAGSGANVTAEAEPSLAFDSPDESITLHVKLAEGRGSAGGYTVVSKLYGRVCTAPCQSSMPPGNYAVALSKDGRDPVDVEGPVDIDGSVSIEGRYNDRRGVRIAGVLVMVGGTGLGLLYGLQKEDNCTTYSSGFESCTPEYPNMTTGLVISSASSLAGLIMMLIPDKAEVSVTPGVASAARGRRQVGQELDSLRGLTLQARF